MNIKDLYTIFQQCQNVVIDSRKIGPGDLFFAFSGENFDAATLAEPAIEQGALAVVVEKEAFAQASKNIFYFPSTLKALQDLAVYHRNRLSIPIVGLTGSNGKTTTKELIHAVLSKKFNTQYTQGNLNNHIGVPLTLLSIRAEHEMAVIEMGANHQKEIEFLSSLAQPDFGYITNFGKAHLEGFGGVEGVIKGKSELYQYLISAGKTILVNQADPIQKAKTDSYPKKISFGLPESDYQYGMIKEAHCVGISFNGKQILSNLTGDYNFNNLCAAASLGRHFEISDEDILLAISEYTPTNMRSQVMKKDGKTLLLDTYNANPTSMEASLRNFAEYEGTKMVIMGDMLELGISAHEEHEKMLTLANNLKFDQVWTVGEIFHEVNKIGTSFLNTTDVKDYLKSHPQHYDNFLLKGSRRIVLEQLIDLL